MPTMTKFEKTFKTGNAPSIFEHGIPGKTFCIGNNVHINGNIYGWKRDDGTKIPIQNVSFCEYCAKKYPQKNIYLSDTKGGSFVCNTLFTDVLRDDYGIDERCLHYDGYRVAVNIVHPENNHIWRPTIKLNSRPETADENGLLISNIPSGSHYEISITTDNHCYNDDYAFKIESIKFGDGNIVTYSTGPTPIGYSNIRHELKANITALINSYHSLKPNTRFYFQRMSETEEELGLTPDHYNKSNKIFITLGLYKKIEEPVYRCSKRGGSLGGGATYSTNGKSVKINTKRETVKYTRYPERKTEISIQLVNDESDEQLEVVSSSIHEKATRELTEKLASLKARKELIATHKKDFLLNFQPRLINERRLPSGNRNKMMYILPQNFH
jgi:hypothetical protein